jgi:phosphoenolpyruvate carboxylase
MKTLAFDNEVDLKFKLYNSIFLTLPLDGIHRTGILLPILRDSCDEGLKDGKTPVEILDTFFQKHTSFTTEKERQDFMFRILQYVERQIVLVDSLEDAAFSKVNDLDGKGSLRALTERLERKNKIQDLKKALSNFGVKIVLTAHPTQFYPGSVLGIITDLDLAIQNNGLTQIQILLQQLGKTPFFQKQKPSPLEEAYNLVWYLENIFYKSAGDLYDKIVEKSGLGGNSEFNGQLISFGFWPGGDRDGNPFVTVDTTLKVAEKLRTTILRNYYSDLRKLRRRLTFQGIYEKITSLEQRFFLAIDEPSPAKRIQLKEIQQILDEIEKKLKKEHNGFYVDLLRSFRNKVRLFGFYYATIDIRQDSRVIKNTFENLLAENPSVQLETLKDNCEKLFSIKGKVVNKVLPDRTQQDTVNTFKAIQEIQFQNGEKACNRFIISNCRQPEDVARVFAMARLTTWKNKIPLDIVPLFETIDDLENAGNTMRLLYISPNYRKHLESRNLQQTIMLGFSDGTKDGGYFSANWNIYKAKENITRISREMGISVIFFDGRGGPPARGGGDMHNFYASLGNEIANQEIQVTIQGQTISSRFGTHISAEYYLELLLTAGLENLLLFEPSKQLSEEERQILEEMSQISLEEYRRFKASEHFLPYLEKLSTLKYYNMANIGSRPSSRKSSSKLEFSDLRAIPFVGAWSQMKQNVPGFFGVGTSLKAMEKKGKFKECKNLYSNSLFFKTLIDNSMQSLCKSYFELTKYMEKDLEFGDFWKWIFYEYQLSYDMLLKVSGQNELLESNPSSKKSIELRESIILPLLVIQQYAMIKIREMELKNEDKDKGYKTYQNLVVRSLYGNINASRNSV